MAAEVFRKRKGLPFFENSINARIQDRKETVSDHVGRVANKECAPPGLLALVHEPF